MKEDVKFIGLHNTIKKLVNKFPYYTVYVTTEYGGFLSNKKLIRKIKVDRKNRIVYLVTEW